MTTFKKSQRKLLRLGIAGTVVVMAALAVASLSGSLLSGSARAADGGGPASNWHIGYYTASPHGTLSFAAASLAPSIASLNFTNHSNTALLVTNNKAQFPSLLVTSPARRSLLRFTVSGLAVGNASSTTVSPTASRLPPKSGSTSNQQRGWLRSTPSTPLVVQPGLGGAGERYGHRVTATHRPSPGGLTGTARSGTTVPNQFAAAEPPNVTGDRSLLRGRLLLRERRRYHRRLGDLHPQLVHGQLATRRHIGVSTLGSTESAPLGAATSCAFYLVGFHFAHFQALYQTPSRM